MFAGVYRVEGLPGKTVRTWLTGARLFPESDALMFARAVYDYLKNWAYGAIEAKTVDQISSAVSPGNRENLAHVLDRLHSLGFVRSPHPGYYCVEGPVATESEFLLTKPTGTGEEPFGTHENHIRTCLYGDVPSGSPSQASPRFKPRSYRIGFDLAVGSWHANTSVSLGRKVDNGHTGIDGGGDSISSTDYSTNGKGVFIVHGRNHTVRDAIALFIANDLGLPIKMMEAGANEGRTLPEKFEDMAEQCAFAVFLLTADDNLIYTADNRLVKRARQNVILEIGYFWAALGRRNRVAFLVENCPDMELPSDLQGIGLIPIKEDLGETKICLQKELRAAGLI
ncbi:MAG: nucleotide-binding protein [Phycisphaerae bacterium]|nr:nucleotide-binding protein [Phycisphaerae bacterium]